MRLWLLLLALAALVVGPMLLRPKDEAALFKGDDKLIVITPHNEAIRAEFGRGFREWYYARTKRTVVVDFRTPGGTSEITRFLTSAYDSSFQKYWQDTTGKPWTNETQAGAMDSKIDPDKTPADDTPAQAARRAFLASTVSCGHDVFFGGGSFDFQKAAGQGHIVDCGYVAAHKDIFGPVIPKTVGGEPYFDPDGRWMGTTIGAFGIAYNRDQLARLGLPEPRQWADLADPRYAHALALANPTQSSSSNKAFEMLIQQQINDEVSARAGGAKLSAEDEAAAVQQGWLKAMQLLQRVSANARYFTDWSSKIALDVEAGEAAAGMTIDFYGRFQSESVRRADGSSRIGYVNAEGGTSFGVDPIALLRGAPHPELARAFIEYVMTDGQKLWGWKQGTPGGPRQHALRRMPVDPALYAETNRALRSDPDVNPYEAAKHFNYVASRTGPLFGPIAFIIRAMCLDPHHELVEAWQALNDAKARLGKYPPEALAAFSDVSRVDYITTKGRILEATKAADKLVQIRLASELSDVFRANYVRAKSLAREGK
jgi:iron(III) transport system substrate-binding protein